MLTGSQRGALQQLWEKADGIGAEGVIGVRFESDVPEGRPQHLVRWSPSARRSTCPPDDRVEEDRQAPSSRR